jgi:hypothetical protein
MSGEPAKPAGRPTTITAIIALVASIFALVPNVVGLLDYRNKMSDPLMD